MTVLLSSLSVILAVGVVLGAGVVCCECARAWWGIER